MLSEARQKREKLNRAKKFSILRPQNLWSGGWLPGSASECCLEFARSTLIDYVGYNK